MINLAVGTSTHLTRDNPNLGFRGKKKSKTEDVRMTNLVAGTTYNHRLNRGQS